MREVVGYAYCPHGYGVCHPERMTSHSGAVDGDAWDNAMAEELRAEMARQRLTLDQYAARSGIPKVSVERYINGKRSIPMRRFPDLCRGLGVSMEEMVSRVVTAVARSEQNGTARQSS